MKVTLLDEQGVQLTEITSHLGRSAGQMLVDWATRPDALFQYYFGGRRAVSVVTNEQQYSAVLGTRWQMGSRFWFLHEFTREPAPEFEPRRLLPQASGLVAGAILHAEGASAESSTAAASLTRGVST